MDALHSIQLVNGILVGTLMFGVANTCELESVRALRKKPQGLIIGSVIQLLVLPFVGWLLLQIIDLPDNIAAGIVITASMPGGTISNVLCLVFQFDVALSVAMTTFSSLAALGMIPLNAYLYLSLTNLVDATTVDWVGMGVTAAIVVFGTVLGFIAKANVSERVSYVFQQIGIISGVILAITSIAINVISEAPLWELPGGTYIALLAFPIIGAGLALGASLLFKLELPSTVTVMVEASVQNVALALGILMASIPDHNQQVQALGVPLVYGGIGNFITLIYCVVLYKRGWSNADRTENVCAAFLRKYYSCCFKKPRGTTVEADIERPEKQIVEKSSDIALS